MVSIFMTHDGNWDSQRFLEKRTSSQGMQNFSPVNLFYLIWFLPQHFENSQNSQIFSHNMFSGNFASKFLSTCTICHCFENSGIFDWNYYNGECPYFPYYLYFNHALTHISSYLLWNVKIPWHEIQLNTTCTDN